MMKEQFTLPSEEESKRLKKESNALSRGLEELDNTKSVEDDRLPEEKDPNSPLYRDDEISETKKSIVDKSMQNFEQQKGEKADDEGVQLFKNVEKIEESSEGGVRVELNRDMDYKKYYIKFSPGSGRTYFIDDKLAHARKVFDHANDLQKENEALSPVDLEQEIEKFIESIKID